jgi:hypothetical protein
MRIMKWSFVLSALLALSGVSLRAQTATSALVSGRVVDESGGVVADAQVTLRNTATNASRDQVTSAEGQYVFSAVEPGAYVLSVIKEGFQRASLADLTFNVNRSYTQDVSLKVGTTATVVQVTSEPALELQTTDASIGNVIAGEEIRHLPTQGRNATELLSLQPGATPLPTSNGNDNFGTTGGSVAGGRGDQNAISLDGIDVSIYASITSNPNPAFPLGVDTISEFRVGVTNPNATFGLAGGAQESVASRSGSNAFHGVGYWYDQNTAFNANEWENNHTIDSATNKLVRRPVIRDNRVGVSIGGPIRRDKTFFFSNYEVRRYDQSIETLKHVPSDNLRNGIVTFNGTQYNLKDFDPRGLGISPTIQSFWNLMPHSNIGAIDSNIQGYLANIPARLKDDSISFRLDHAITSNLHFFGRYQYSRDLDPARLAQADLTGVNGGGAAKFVGLYAALGDGATTGLDWVIRPTLTNSFRFGWIRARLGNAAVLGSTLAGKYNLPGTASLDGPVTLEPANANSTSNASFLDFPTDVPAGRNQMNSANYQFRDDLNWTKGNHTFAFGGSFSILPVYFLDSQRIQGPSNFVSATLDAGQNGSNLALTSAERPPTLPAASNSTWDRLFAAATGMVDSTSIVAVRDKNLAPLPPGTPVVTNTRQGSHYFYAQDTWRIRPSLTLSYGLSYGWQTPPRERDGKGMVLIDQGTGKPIDSATYINTRRNAALQGQIYNPNFAHLPYGKLGMSGAWNTDWSDIGPRVSLAWSPSASEGFLGKTVGQQKTVVRMGYGIVYDRVNYLTEGIVNLGFSQNLTLITPLCNDPVAVPGPGCNGASSDPGLSSFRVGVDGPNIPVPPPDKQQTLPYASSPASPEFWDFEMDPNVKVARNHLIDFSIQRELPGHNLVELGYIGRLGRRLGNAVSMTTPPYMFKDPASGQSFAQAFDCVAQFLRGLPPPASPFPCASSTGALLPQPWFENQLSNPARGPWGAGPDGCNDGSSNTACIAFLDTHGGGNFVPGNLGTLGGMFSPFAFPGSPFIDGIRKMEGLPQFSNHQQDDLEVHQSHDWSDYHALTATWRNSGWVKGLEFDLSYTFSKSMDNGGRIQIYANGYDDAFNPMADHGPSFYDRTHVFNATYNYDLPFGKGRLLNARSNGVNYLVGGWYTAGIFTASSGLPEIVAQGAGAPYGGGVVSTNPVGEIPTGSIALASGLNRGVFSSQCQGVDYGIGQGQPGSTGLNLFGNPGASACAFRPILLSVDQRSGRDNPLRGLPNWNLDFRLGKETSITERVKVELSADFFNLFNHVNFNDPGQGAAQGGLNLNNASNFGTITSQAIPANRLGGSRWIEMGLRFSF